jgi:hypothetical protein
MFPQFREQLGTALDLIVEFSTLGEYRLGVDHAHGAAGAPAVAPGHAPQLGGAGSPAGRAAVRRTVAGGATGRVPVATPAARRLLGLAESGETSLPPAPPEALLPRPLSEALFPPPPPEALFPPPAPEARLPRPPPEPPKRTGGPCHGDRRRPAPPRRVRARPRAAPEQLCFAI